MVSSHCYVSTVRKKTQKKRQKKMQTLNSTLFAKGSILLVSFPWSPLRFVLASPPLQEQDAVCDDVTRNNVTGGCFLDCFEPGAKITSATAAYFPLSLKYAFERHLQIMQSSSTSHSVT